MAEHKEPQEVAVARRAWVTPKVIKHTDTVIQGGNIVSTEDETTDQSS